MASNNSKTQGQATGKMRCMQKDCQNEFDSPIEIFNGQLICPFCGKELVKKEFYVDENNDNIFKLAQMYFGEYLSRVSIVEEENADPDDLAEEEIEKRRTLLTSAIWHCREAAVLGHPEARVMLGYFWEIGYMDRGSGLDKYKMAYHYYYNVCTTAEIKVNGTIDGYENGGSAQLKKVREDAAHRLLHMLSQAPAELETVTKGNNKPYVLEDNIEKMRALSLIRGEYSSKKALSVASNSHADTVIRTLQSVIKRDMQAPVFGYFILSYEEFLSLYDTAGQLSLKVFSTKYSNAIDIYYALSPKSELDSAVFYHMDSRGINKSVSEEGAEGKMPIYLYFSSKKPKLSDDMKKTLKRVGGKPVFAEIANALITKGKRSDTLLGLIQAETPVTDHVFYPEDVFFSIKLAGKGKANGKKAMERLATFIKEAAINEG